MDIIKNLFIITLLTLCACGNNQSGEFVYIDSRDILHTDKNCNAIYVKGEHGEEYYLSVDFINKNVLSKNDFKTYCNLCVEDKHVEELDHLSVTNTVKRLLKESYYSKWETGEGTYNIHPHKLEEFIEENPNAKFIELNYNKPTWLRTLYNKLCDKFNMPDYEDFVVDIQNEQKRRKAYNAISGEYELGTYDEFCEAINNSFNGEAINNSFNGNRRWLYDLLTSKKYNVGKDFEEFNNLMSTNEKSRKWVYDTATSLGINVGKNYEEFEKLINPQ